MTSALACSNCDGTIFRVWKDGVSRCTNCHNELLSGVGPATESGPTQAGGTVPADLLPRAVAPRILHDSFGEPLGGYAKRAT